MHCTMRIPVPPAVGITSSNTITGSLLPAKFRLSLYDKRRHDTCRYVSSLVRSDLITIVRLALIIFNPHSRPCDQRFQQSQLKPVAPLISLACLCYRYLYFSSNTRHVLVIFSYELITHIIFVAECLIDLNFVVDSSGSINYRGPTNWDRSLQFVANISSQFEIGPNNVQVAFVLFSTVATVEWGLTQYRDKASLVNAILNVRYLDMKTNLNDALYLTRTVVFAPGRGTRPGATKITIILTDGDDDVPSPGTPLTIQNATACKNAGIRLIVVGVSSSVNEHRLRQIVSDQQRDYHAVDDFNALTNVVLQLAPQICGTTAAPVPSIRLHSICSARSTGVVYVCSCKKCSRK